MVGVGQILSHFFPRTSADAKPCAGTLPESLEAAAGWVVERT